MSLYALKPKFQSLLRSLVGRLFHAGVTANQVTIAAAVLSVVLGGLMSWPATQGAAFACLPLFLFFRMALNAIDGMLAREFGQQSRLGGILNELGDVVSDAALYLPFALLAGVHWPLVAVFVLLACFTEMVGVTAVAVGASRRYDGPFGKADRAAVLGALALVGTLWGWPGSQWLNLLFAVLAVLSAWTIVNRIRRALAEATSAQPARPLLPSDEHR